jgi:hypothetical protein
MKKCLLAISLCLIWFNISFSEEPTNDLKKLADLYNKGSISKDEFNKAKSILLKIKENNKKKLKLKEEKSKKIIIQQFTKSVSKKEFEKMEMIIGDFRIYTFRPGGIKIRRISDNTQLAVIGDTGKVRYYNNSDALFELLKPTENKTVLKLNNVPILVTEMRYVKKHRATFNQIMALGTKPFHYFIRLKDKSKVIGLNYHSFDKKIEKAMEKAKIRLASVHNVTIAQINALIKKRESKAAAELEKIVGAEKDDFLAKEIANEIGLELQRQLDEALGANLASEFVSAIEEAFNVAIEDSLEAELAAELNDIIAEAISSGISEAAISAGIQAYLDAIASGASEADAYAAGEEACGC